MQSSEVFEFIGVYFTNAYWNRLFKRAETQWKKKEFREINDAYKTNIEIYNDAFSKKKTERERYNKHYIQILRDLQEEYMKYAKTTNITLVGFIDVVSKCLLPRKEYSQLPRQHRSKDKIVRQALSQSLSKFTIYIIENEIPCIISNRYAADDVKYKHMTRVKNKFIEFLTFEKEKLYSISIAGRNGVNLEENPMPRTKDIAKPLKKQIKELIAEKSDLISRCNKYVDLINKLKEIIVAKDKIIQDASKHSDASKQSDADDTSSSEEQKPEPVSQTPIETEMDNIKDIPAVQEMENDEYEGEDFTAKPDQDVLEVIGDSSEEVLQVDD